MKVVIRTQAEIGVLVADAVQRLLESKPDAALGLATGSSPLVVYSELVRRFEAGEISFAQAKAFTLDEYVGLPADHPESYRNVIGREFTDRVDFAPGAVRTPDGNAGDLPGDCADFERAIVDAGGVDLQLLGIGTDGHIAFNEPTSSLSSRTRVKRLHQQTREDNARFFGGDVDSVPEYAVTQGLGTIMDARHVVLVAFGVGKAEAVAQLVEGPVSAMWPATILQHHPHATVLVDEAAAGRLVHTEHFRSEIARPGWPHI
ncbi:MAG TPA: glucosamine-6-phosphate deaminase [Actinomycetaceae bacterium]|nr:glucosamine-6-phosphate deaminase [Actinomycetaceae bacterium]